MSRHGGAAALATVLLAGAVQHAGATADGALPPVLTFSAGYKSHDKVAQNVVELGVVKQCARGRRWCMDLTRYGSAAPIRMASTGVLHAMQAPYASQPCSNGPALTPTGGISVRGVPVRLKQSSGRLSVAWDGMEYHWKVDEKVANAYVLDQLARRQHGALDQAVGFAFSSSAELKGDIRKEQLASLYQGQIHHKTAFTKVDGAWESAPSSIDFRPFQEAADGRSLGRSIPGHAAVVKKYGKPMWVQSTVVLARGDAPIAPLIQEYGHDFGMDGCFNEAGHNKLMLPVGDGQVTALVYIEYSPDHKRGFPMLSVGRYYR